MKTLVLKSVLPAFSMLLAVGGAISSQKPASKKLVNETGWINLVGSPCHTSKQCRTEIGTACTLFYNGQYRAVLGKDSNMVCNRELYEIPQ